MPNQIDRDVYVTRDVLKTPIQYVRGTDYLPIVMHFRDFNIPEDASAQVFIAKPSGNIFYGAATISGNDVTIATEEQMFIELGLTLMQISIQDNNKELISFAQPVYVSQNLKSGDLPDSTTDIKFLDQAIQEANEAVDTATTAAQQAAIAVQNANQAIQNANGLISELSEQVSSLNTNYASLVNGVSIPQLNTTLKTVVGALNELNSKTTVETGTWTPVLTAGVEVKQGNGSYYKIGRLVICNVAIWIDSSQATDDDLYISLPYASSSSRAYGIVGYIEPFIDFSNVCVGILGSDNRACLIYSPSDASGVTDIIKGSEMNTSIQFTIAYITT